MNRAIIWDADGVLFDTFDERGNFRWSANIYDDLGINLAVLNDIFSREWNEVLLGRKYTREHIEKVLQKHRLPLTADDFISYWLEKDIHVNKEILKLVDPSISYIGTNQDPVRSAHIEKIFSGKFLKIFASSAIGFMKPCPKFYSYIEDFLGLSPKQITLIDDTKANIDAAISRGWNAHIFTNPRDLYRTMGHNVA